MISKIVWLANNRHRMGASEAAETCIAVAIPLQKLDCKRTRDESHRYRLLGLLRGQAYQRANHPVAPPRAASHCLSPRSPSGVGFLQPHRTDYTQSVSPTSFDSAECKAVLAQLLQVWRRHVHGQLSF